MEQIYNQIKYKVYFGQYTLAYWIKLLLNGSIEIPEYQRSYVWQTESANPFLKSIKENHYIPPVTIGAFKDSTGKNHNYIIDGQQRLTTILLAAIGKFPRKDAYKYSSVTGSKKVFTIPAISARNETLESLKMTFHSDELEDMQVPLLPEDLETKFLNFSFIVPDSDQDNKDVKRFYINTFYEINSTAVELAAYETRRAMYFLNEKYVPLFDAKVLEGYSIKRVGSETPADFVRYLAILSEYDKANKYINIGSGYGSSVKKDLYYLKYVSDIMLEDSAQFVLPSSFIANLDIEAAMSLLKANLESLNFKKEFSSIIEMDYYFFGLIYYSLFKHKNISVEKKNAIEQAINKKLSSIKDDDRQKVEPNAWSFLRNRLSASLKIYKRIVEDE